MARHRADRPRAVAFDVIETLFSLEPLRSALVDAGLEHAALEWWFAQVLRDGFALSATDAFEPFAAVATHGLRSIAERSGLEVGTSWAEDVVATMSSLPAHDDAAPAFERLVAARVPIVALTNGSAATTAALLKGAGLGEAVGAVVSIGDVGRWKPWPEPYHAAAGAAGVAPEELALVAVHGWDVHGAACAGLLTGWARRLEKVLAPWVPPPDAVGETTVEVVERLLALGGD